VYLSDSGGHGNLWVIRTDGSSLRQLTTEQEADVAVGVPVWSPVSNDIAFILTRVGQTSQWLINADGSGRRRLVEQGIWACWSRDGRWLYYVVPRIGSFNIEKIPVEGGPARTVRTDFAVAPAVGPEGKLYFATILTSPNGAWDFELRVAQPEDGPAHAIARFPGTRVPVDPANFHTVLSPDGKWLATPLMDGQTTNLWVLSAGGGAMRQVTDFGDQAVVIARRVSWSPDARYLYAAVAEIDADIVALNGLVP
jgi:Tol biopolymer transport system component